MAREIFKKNAKVADLSIQFRMGRAAITHSRIIKIVGQNLPDLPPEKDWKGLLHQTVSTAGRLVVEDAHKKAANLNISARRVTDYKSKTTGSGAVSFDRIPAVAAETTTTLGQPARDLRVQYNMGRQTRELARSLASQGEEVSPFESGEDWSRWLPLVTDTLADEVIGDALKTACEKGVIAEVITGTRSNR